MKIIIILLSVAFSFSKFGNLRRKSFYNHHFPRNNRTRPSLVMSKNPSTGLRLNISNKAEQHFIHDVASLAVINKMMKQFMN